MADKSLPSPNMHLEKNLSLAMLIDQPLLSLNGIESKLFSPNRMLLIRVKSKFIQTMGYSVEVSVDRTACLAKVVKHSSPADPSETDAEESRGLFDFCATLDQMKKAILDETSEGNVKKTRVDSSDEEDEKQRLRFIQTFDMLYPEEALYQMENGTLVIYQVDVERKIHLPLSVQQCYETFFQVVKPPAGSDHALTISEISMDDYIVYSHLVKLGYIMRRHQRPKEACDESSGQSLAKPDLPDFDTTPLVDRDQLGRLKLSSIMNQLDFIPSISVADLKKKLAAPKRQAEFQILYDVHMPSKTFKKSKPGVPAYHVLTRRRQHVQDKRTIPDLAELVSNVELRQDEAKPPYLYAFVNENGEFSFYNFDFKSLPIINELD